MNGEHDPAIQVRGLDFRYERDRAPVLRDLSLEIGAGWRCLLLGANGAGKSTLLRVLAGKHMVPEDRVRVLGRSAFHDTDLVAEVALLGGNFPFEVDLTVRSIVAGVRGADPARRQRLIEVLDIDLDWHMHRVSDGQRRRVQLLLGLMRPQRVLLLDEVTTDLDVIARQDLLAFLREDSEQRGTTILYATHIFDGLDEWATHLAYLVKGRLQLLAPLDELPELRARRERGESAPLLRVVLDWLRAERAHGG